MKADWSPEAIDDLAALRAYISEDDPAAARRVRVYHAARRWPEQL